MNHSVSRSTVPLIVVSNLGKDFRTPTGTITAVDGVSFAVEHGQTMGLVGESGSGKSTVAQILLGLQSASRGSVSFDGTDVLEWKRKLNLEYCSRVQAVFQNPSGSLLPHYSVLDNVIEPLRIHRRGSRAARRSEAFDLCELVGVSPSLATRYPNQLSGGQQQRVEIARALALKPDLLVCDEPTSSLDVSIQAQILALFERLKTELGLTCLFISHNLAVIERLADQVVVMSKGNVVESGTVKQVFNDPPTSLHQSVDRVRSPGHPNLATCTSEGPLMSTRPLIPHGGSHA